MTLCEICDALEISHEPGEEQRLGTWEELTDRSTTGCEGCSFFTTTLKTSAIWSYRLEELQEKVVFLDSLRLDVKKPDRLDRRTWSCDDLLFDICSLENVKDENPEIDSRRPVPVRSRDEKCIDQIRSWFQECLHHDNCTYLGRVPMPKRAIKVPKDSEKAPKLVVTNGQQGEYLVLSHTWDDSDTSKLTSLNLQQFQQGIDLTDLSQNFQDAFEITRRLGFEYIWIDALCVIQDDEDDRNKEASATANTFGLATMMISATNASDSQSGIFSDRHVYYSPMLGRTKDLCLRLHLLRWQWDIEHSPSASLAWAAQERMMSPRVLHFTKRQVIWECASEWYYEASGIPDKKHGSGQIESGYRKVVFQPIVNEKLRMELPDTHELKVSRPQANSSNNSEVEGGFVEIAKQLRPWLQNVSEYSGRSMPVSSDKLPAVAGMAAIIDNGTMGEYLAGIWSKGIRFGLSWGRQYALLTKPAEYRAPSWSWASIDGKVSYDVPACITKPSVEPSYKLPWLDNHQPILLEHNMILRYPGKAYMGVQKGSYIVLEGSCIPFKLLADASIQDRYFRPNVVPDSCSLFDCSVCGPHEEGEHVHDILDVASLLLALYGERWDNYDGYITLLMLRKSRDDPEAFERSGAVRLSRENAFQENDPNNFARALDDLGFERKTLKLV